MIKKYWPLLTLVSAIPYYVYADDRVLPLLGMLKKWLDLLIPISVAIALLYFIWSVITLIRSDEEGKREEAKQGMWWGVVALFVIISIWGITKFIREVFSISGTDAPIDLPTIPDNASKK